MPDATLTLTVKTFTAKKLIIDVKNDSRAALDKSLQLEITLPKEMLSADLRNKADQAPRQDPPIANVNAFVKGTEGKFSVWVEPETSDHFITIRFFNDLDKDAADIPAIPFAAGAIVTIEIPLDEANHASINLPYGYEYDGKPRKDSTLELKVETLDWTPRVSLWTDFGSPTAIDPMSRVTINWKIEDGVSAELRGPLPGGNTEWSLSDKSTSKFKMSQGSFDVYAVASMTFMLQAEVKGPTGKPNVLVARMLSLDIALNAKYGALRARPSRVLPYGLVELDWAAWGVNIVKISTPVASRQIALTDISLSGFAQGSGVLRITAQKIEGESGIPARLEVELKGAMVEVDKTSCSLAAWTEIKDKPQFTGRPLGLAVAAGNMALLTTDGIWIAEVGEYDDFEKVGLDLDFTQAVRGTWLAIAALGNKFVALRQTARNGLQVAIYDSHGASAGIPPLDLKPLMGSDPVFDFAVYGDRAYVVVESTLQTGKVRSAFSVGFDYIKHEANSRNEILLECLLGYRLLTFDNALFALNRDSGQMLRIELKGGKLEAFEAASAVDQQGKSMVKQGLLVSAGRVLAVLSPTSVPSLTSLANYGLKNVLPYQNVTLLQAPKTTPQDLVYSPQTNRWSRCGHGLDTKEGVVAFRGGDSRRLWVIDLNHNAYTLSDANEALFLPDYVKDLPSKPLAPFFKKKRELSFINNTGMEFVLMNETCLKAALKPFSSTGLAYLSSPIPLAPTSIKRAEPVELHYNDDVAPTATLRLLAKRGLGVKHEYVLEVALSGRGFSDSVIGFKQLTVNAQGGVSVVDVPNKLRGQVALDLIEVFPKGLSNGIRLKINNATPYALWLRSPDMTTAEEQEKKHDPAKPITIRYDTPPFSIYAHGVGEFPVDVDFALPDGIEMSPGSEVQKHRIRIRNDAALPFGIEVDPENGPVQKMNDYDAYEFTLRYKVQRKLGGAFLGDGVPSHDGSSIYLPIVEPPNVTNTKLLKIDANNLQTTTQIGVVRVKNIFYCPGSVAVLSDVVVAVMDGKTLSMWDPSLRPHSEFSIELFELDVVTNLKHSSSNSIVMVGVRETPTFQCKQSYKTESWHFAQYPSRQSYGWLNFLKNFKPGRVPGVPAWVGLNTISPMDMRPGAAEVICVEGGIIGRDIKNNDNDIGVELPGTGRQEAILVDPVEHVVFSVHSKPSRSALLVSRVNLDRPSEKITKEHDGGVMHIVTDLNPPTDPKLDYYRRRAISLLATSDALFVSNGLKIYVLDKTTLTQRQVINVDLPTRLIQVKRVKLPGENHQKYGAPKECYLLWGIASMYGGDGYTVKGQGQDFETILYKISVMP